ncbi:Fc.00g046950.m01.CDS01 [Cosmosporella sp. VM-42]
MEAVSFNEAGGKFLQWFKSLPGAEFSDAIKIVDLRDRNAGRGIIAAEDISPDATLFTIPRKGIINVETSELPKKIPDVFDLNAVGDDDDAGPQMDSWSSLILVMIYEYLQGNSSKWKPYFDVLPSAFDTPMFWSENELEYLQASHMRSKIGKAEAEEMFRSRLLPVIRKHSDLFSSSETRSDAELIQLAHRMGSTIMAYAFDLENDEEPEDGDESEEWVEDREGKSMMGMVPMADILNADAEFNAHINHGEDSLTATALRPIKAGEEILNYYGPHPNSELLRRYGYVTEKHSRYDVVEIPWSLVENVMATEFGISKAILEKLRNESDEEEIEDTFVLERETSEPNSDGTFASFAIFENMPEDLQQQLKGVLKAVKKAQPDAIPDKRKRDEIHQAVLVKTIERLASRYPTSIAEDGLLLKSQNLSSRARMAIQVRIGEKKLLQEALAASTADEDTEMTMGGEEAPQKRARR